jgi:two-component system, LuxR family, sensor kinase FixL
VVLAKARAQIERADASLASLRALARSARPVQSVVPLETIVGDLARDLAAVGAGEGIRVTVNAAPTRVSGDPAFVRVILENLLANSMEGLRQRGGDGEIGIEVTTSGPNAVVRVHDDGPGIEPDRQSHIFEPLSGSKPSGLGLGLSIARALAHTMHGELALVREPGWATTFELCLPVAT